MFGLLKHRPHDPGHRADFRKSYCGTCKAIGKMYGHKERLLLNNDVVFLSELLAELSGNSDDFAAISVNRCFSLPKHQNQIPDFLAYTASINMLLASIKVKDNMEDSKHKANVWQALAWLQKAQFEKAERHLNDKGLQLQYVEAIVREHLKREHETIAFSDTAAGCMHYSETTGLLTGEIFRQSAGTVQKPESAESLYQIGKAYGEIVYLVDALTDYEKDLKSGSFNFLLVGAGRPAASLSPQAADLVHQNIATNLRLIRKHLFELPIADQKKQLFAERLESSVTGALGTSNACPANTACHTPRISIAEKYRLVYTRSKLAFTPANRHTVRLAGAALAASLVALVLLALPLRVDAITPAPNPGNTCWQDCVDSCAQECCNCCCDSICESICK